MKQLFLLSIFLCFHYLIQAIPLKVGGKFSEGEIKCIESLDLDKDSIESILRDEAKFFPEDNEKFNEFMFCSWQEKGNQNADGSINYDKIIERIEVFPQKYFGGKSNEDILIGHKIATSSVDSCRDVSKGNSHGHTAVKTQNCIDKHMFELVDEAED